MRVADFDFPLQQELIAQEPLPDRSASRMMRLDRGTGNWQDLAFRDFPELLRPDDLLVVNNSRVFPARLFGRRSGLRSQPLSPRNPASRDFLQGRVEVLLVRQLGPWEWEALVRPGRKLGIGERITFTASDHSDQSPAPGGPEGGAAALEAEIIARGEYGERTLRFAPVADFIGTLETLGHVPLPPYIAREDRPGDRERYQTVYARRESLGSVASPTAGLHFTPEILARIRERGIEIAEITLHVGLGTFQPIHADKVEDHKMHREAFSISEQAAAQINSALDQRRRVVAVGTTTVRTLEYAASFTKTGGGLRTDAEIGGVPALAAGTKGRIEPGSGEADIFIYPGFQFRVVGALLTNFHLPKSTLLMLVSAFAGRENILRAYQHAVNEKYRFFSYGDCMLIE